MVNVYLAFYMCRFSFSPTSFHVMQNVSFGVGALIQQLRQYLFYFRQLQVYVRSVVIKRTDFCCLLFIFLLLLPDTFI